MLLRRTSFFLLFLAIICSFSGLAQNNNTISQQLDNLISKRLPAVAPGGVVLIASGDKTVYHKAFGIANLELAVPMQENMLFRIGSIGKQFTAIAVLQLAEQKKLSLQDDIRKYLKDFLPAGPKISVENLLTHSSGIKNYFEIKMPDPNRDDNTYRPKDIIDLIKLQPLEFTPGSQFKYSNSNYFILAYIIEQVTHSSYETYLQHQVLDKAGLTATFYIHPEKIIPGKATGYSKLNNHWENASLESVNITYGAGALISNAADLLKWHIALRQHKLISQESLERAYSAFRLSNGKLSEYGYGWFIKVLDGSKTIEHSGSTDGFQSDEIYLPDTDTYIVTLFNGFKADMEWQILSNDIARIAAGKPLQQDKSLNQADLAKYTGTYEVFAGTDSHRMVVSMKDNKLFIEATNPKDRLPQVQLHAESENSFYIKEAELKFVFVKGGDSFKLVTYNNRGKDAEWKKIK